MSTNIKKIMLLSAISLAITTSSYADSIVKDITSSGQDHTKQLILNDL